MVALVIAALPMMIISRVKQNKILTAKSLKSLAVITLVLVLVQIVLGTGVREQTDEISRSLKYEQRNLWIDSLGVELLIHRSFSWIVAASCIYLFWQSRFSDPLRRHSLFILFFLVCSFTAGLIMYFMNIPAWAQPVHLLFASLLAISLFSFRLQMK
jgi:cytochrome c oxidase assembly protein subunit 15